MATEIPGQAATSLSKRVIGGSGVITLASVGARLLAFATVPVLTRLLGPDAYGVAALAGTFVGLGSVFGLLGMDMAYARYFLQEDKAGRAAVERFCWRFSIFSGVGAAALAGTGGYVLGQRWLPDTYQWIAPYFFFAIIFSVLATMATTRTRIAGNFRKIAIVLFISALVSVAVTVIIAIAWRRDFWALLLGAAAVSVTTFALLGLPGRSTILSQSNLPAKKKRAILGLGIAGGITAPMYWIISSGDRWFLAEYASAEILGVYFLASSVALVGLMLNSSLTLTWFPEASRLYGEQSTDSLASLGRLWGRLVAGLALVWVAVAAAGGDVLRLLAAPEFHVGAAYIPWLAGGVFFYGLAGLANTVYFLNGRMNIVAAFWIAGSVASVALNLWLVPTYSAHGAALVQCLSFALISFGIVIGSRKILPMPVNWPRLGACLTIALVAGAIMSPAWLGSPAMSLVVKFPFGVAISVLMCAIIAPDWLQRGFSPLWGLVSHRNN